MNQWHRNLPRCQRCICLVWIWRIDNFLKTTCDIPHSEQMYAMLLCLILYKRVENCVWSYFTVTNETRTERKGLGFFFNFFTPILKITDILLSIHCHPFPSCSVLNKSFFHLHRRKVCIWEYNLRPLDSTIFSPKLILACGWKLLCPVELQISI